MKTKNNVICLNKKSLKTIYNYMCDFPGVRQTDLIAVRSRFEKKPRKAKERSVFMKVGIGN